MGPDPAIKKDVGVLADFISIYCGENHGDRERRALKLRGKLADYIDSEVVLCEECGKLLLHAASKRIICPFDPKPQCKHCETHCYAPGYREKIRQVMKFSGMYLIKKGRVRMLKKYFF